MEDFLRNFRSGFALACGFPITRDDFRPGLKQTASLGAIVVILILVMRQMTVGTPGAASQTEGPGPFVLLLVGCLGSVYMVRAIQNARLSLIGLITLILSAEMWVLLFGAAAWRLVTRFPSTYADQAQAMLPWLILGWMILIVLRSAKVLAGKP